MRKTSLGQIFLDDDPMKSHLNLGPRGKCAGGCCRSRYNRRGRVNDWLPTRRGEARGKGGSHVGMHGGCASGSCRFRWRTMRRNENYGAFIWDVAILYKNEKARIQ